MVPGTSCCDLWCNRYTRVADKSIPVKCPMWQTVNRTRTRVYSCIVNMSMSYISIGMSHVACNEWHLFSWFQAQYIHVWCYVVHIDIMGVWMLAGLVFQVLDGESRRAEEELAALKLKQADVHVNVGLRIAEAVGEKGIGGGAEVQAAEDGVGADVKSTAVVEAENEVRLHFFLEIKEAFDASSGLMDRFVECVLLQAVCMILHSRVHMYVLNI